MECLRPLLVRSTQNSDHDAGHGGGARPLSFGFDPDSWSLGCGGSGVSERHQNDGELTRTMDGTSPSVERQTILDIITLRPRHLIELSGEASAGKTQLCLQLVAHAVLSGAADSRSASRSTPVTLNRAVYLFTEGGTAKMDRLRQMVLARLRDEALTDAVMRQVHVEYASSVDEVITKLVMLEDVFQDGGEKLSPVTLLVVDSIAHVFRFREDDKYGAAGMRYDASRTHAFFRIASILKRYADEYNVIVLVTNQIVDAVDEAESNMRGVDCVQDRPGCAGLRLETGGRLVYPALGLAWASCVGTRLFLTKETARCDETGEQLPVVVRGRSGGKQLRGMQVVFSPELRQVKTHFVIDTSGCVGVDVGSVDLGFSGQ